MIEIEEVTSVGSAEGNGNGKSRFELEVTKLSTGFLAVDDHGRQHAAADFAELAIILGGDMIAHGCCDETGTKFHITVEKE